MPKAFALLKGALFAACVLTGCLNSDGGTEIPNGVRGRLVDPQGNPVAGATVQLFTVDYVASLSRAAAGSAVTDDNGAYSLSVPGEGVFNIEGKKEDAGVFIDSVRVSGTGVDVPQDTLKPLGAVRGISRMPGESDLNQVRVTLYIPGTRQITKPSPGGAFLFPGMPEGRYRIVLDPTLDDYDVKVLEVTVTAGDTLDLDTVEIELHRPDTVSVNGGTASGAWGPGTTYLIQGNVNVPTGSSLTIRPGTRVIFRGGYRISGSGVIRAIGKPDSLILFSYGFATGFWGGLSLTHPNSVLSYSIVERSETGLAVAADSTAVSHCVFRYNNGGVMAARFYDNVFHDNTGLSTAAVVIGGNRLSDFRNNIFARNLIAVSRYSCQTSAPPVFLSSMSVRASLFYQNGRDFAVQNCEASGYGNDFFVDPVDTLNADPQFVSLEKGREDYHLKPGSPAKGAGVGGTDMGIYSTYVPE